MLSSMQFICSDIENETDDNQHRFKAASLTSSWFGQLAGGLSFSTSLILANGWPFQCGNTFACTYQRMHTVSSCFPLSDVPALISLNAVVGYLVLLSTSAFSIFCPVRNCHIPPLQFSFPRAYTKASTVGTVLAIMAGICCETQYSLMGKHTEKTTG